MSRREKLNKAYDQIIRFGTKRRRELAIKGAMLDDGYLNALYWLKNQIDTALSINDAPKLKDSLLINRAQVKVNIWERIGEIRQSFRVKDRDRRNVGNYNPKTNQKIGFKTGSHGTK